MAESFPGYSEGPAPFALGCYLSRSRRPRFGLCRELHRYQSLHEATASAVVLPAHSLASIKIEPGDQLRICRGDRTKVVAGQQLLPDERCILDPEPNQKPKEIKRAVPTSLTALDTPAPKRSLKEKFLLWIYPKAENSDRRRAPGFLRRISLLTAGRADRPWSAKSQM